MLNARNWGCSHMRLKNITETVAALASFEMANRVAERETFRSDEAGTRRPANSGLSGGWRIRAAAVRQPRVTDQILIGR